MMHTSKFAIFQLLDTKTAQEDGMTNVAAPRLPTATPVGYGNQTWRLEIENRRLRVVRAPRC